MRANSLKFFIKLLFFLLPVGYVIAWALNPNDYQQELLILLICHIFMAICLGVIFNHASTYFFEPILFVFFLYYMIFVFTPIYNIFIDNVTELGINTMGGCIKGTLVFMFGFIGMMMGYYSKGSDYDGDTKLIADKKVRAVLTYSWFVWIIGIVGYLFYNRIVGRSFIYMLSFGVFGGGLRGGGSFDVVFLSMIIYISFVPMMMILIYSKSKFAKFLVYFITCVPLATRGFRSMLIIPMFAPLIYRHIKEKKRPSLKTIVIGGAVLILILGALAYTRNTLRAGYGFNFEGYKYSQGADGALDYFGSYKVYYGAVEHYPSVYNYTFGRQLLYTLTMYVPRALWTSKPAPKIYEVIGRSVGPIAVAAGSAWPNIGEYYTEFGIFGVFFLEMILGNCLKWMKTLYNRPYVTNTSLSLYALYLPTLLSVIAYGYTAGNTPQFIFMALPIIGYRMIERRN